MLAITKKNFLTWAATAGIAFDPRYPDSGCLTLLPDSGITRFWVLPDLTSCAHFAGTILDGLDDWDFGYLWPRSGAWPLAANSSHDNEQVRDVVLRGAGIPDGWAGGVCFSHEELPKVIAVLFFYLASGWHGDDDLFFIPDHARQLVQTDHHGVVHVSCTDEPTILQLVQDMEEAGYPLPSEPPDWTFKWPEWMPRPGPRP